MSTRTGRGRSNTSTKRDADDADDADNDQDRAQLPAELVVPEDTQVCRNKDFLLQKHGDFPRGFIRKGLIPFTRLLVVPVVCFMCIVSLNHG